MTQPELTSDQREDLVAYLDGELDEQASAEIEHLLAKSEAARQEVDALEQTWDLLDALPQVRASDTFTARTMSTVKVEEVRPPLLFRFRPRRLRRAAIVLVCLAGTTASAAAGFFVAYSSAPEDSETLVRELPVIEKLDVYREIQELEYLQQLEQSGLLNDETESNLE